MKIDKVLLKSSREARNWTQQVVAQMCNVSLRTIQRAERTGDVSMDTLDALSAVFEIPSQQLLCSAKVLDKDGITDAQISAALKVLLLAQLSTFAVVFWVADKLTPLQLQVCTAVISLSFVFSFVLIGTVAYRKGMIS